MKIKKKIKITIVTPTFNSEKNILKNILSIKNQNLKILNI